MVDTTINEFSGLWSRLPDTDDRIALWNACRTSPRARQLSKQASAKSAAWFINSFVYTYDSREDAPVHKAPFILYPFQVRFIQAIEDAIKNLTDLIVHKTRDMGATWCYEAWIIHGWLFKDGFNVLIGSRKEEMVDNFTRESLFGRLKYIIENLPKWLLPRGFEMRKHRKERRITNPENGNEITGESTSYDFGRQARYTAVFYDEFAFWPDAKASWGSASESTRTRVAVSTVNARNPQNFFYELLTNENIKTPIHRMFWREHPRKTQEWYDNLPNRLTADEIKYEIDGSFDVSGDSMVYPGWATVKFGAYDFQPNWELYTSWDFGIQDTSIIWWQRNPNTGDVYMIDSYQGHNNPIDFYVPFVLGYVPAGWNYTYEFNELDQIAMHGQWGQSINFGDPAGNARSANDGRSPIEILQQHKVHMRTNSSANTYDARKRFTELNLRYVHVNDARCALVDSSMKNARYPERRGNSQATTPIRQPIHDWTSHYRSAVEYFFVNVAPYRPKAQSENPNKLLLNEGRKPGYKTLKLGTPLKRR